MKKKIIIISCVLLALGAGAVELADPPKATITNGDITANLYLPDATNGYYQATRFDWSGIVYNLEYKGHKFYGQWYDRYSPKTNDAVMGPAEAFAPLGYDDVKPGGTFTDIGIGTLRKPVEKAYTEFKTYEIVDAGKWTVTTKADRVEFTHELHDSTGYAYIYTKTVRLVKGKPMLVVEHSLKNTGKKAIATNVFCHNFPLIDNEPTGPNMKFIFPYAIQPAAEGSRGWGTIAAITGNEVNFLRPLTNRESLFTPVLQGPGTTSAKDYDFKIQNQKTGAGIHITADQPLLKVVVWANPRVACIEPYINVNVAPGKTMKWNLNYEYYTFAPTAK